MARCELLKFTDDNGKSFDDFSRAKGVILSEFRFSDSKKKKVRFKAYLKDCRFSLVKNIFLESGAEEVKVKADWILSWTDGPLSLKDFSALKPYQKINHFPGMSLICQKDLLAQHLNSMKQRLPQDYNFYPLTFCLPEDLRNLTDYCEFRKHRDIFIIKPDTSCQGVGIELVKGVKNFKKYRNVVCQKYVCKPFLWDGFKMDLRLYVLITSVSPLRIYLYKEGLVRLATKPYQKPSVSNLHEKRMHLTNYAVNKNSGDSSIDENEEECKKSLYDLEEYFNMQGLSITETWDIIEGIIVKTILSVIPKLQHLYKTTFPYISAISSCYEVLGFDILLNNKVKPFILEVNRSPSLGASSSTDRELKQNLIRDMLNMILLTPKQINFIKCEEHVKSIRRLTNISIVKSLTPREQVLFKYQESKENRMCGNFKKIYPVEDCRYDVIYETAFNIFNG